MLIRTGSKNHNIMLARRAIDTHMQLKADGTGLSFLCRYLRFPIESEEHIFRLLNLPYRIPEEQRVIASTHITFAEFIYLLLLTTTGVVLNATNAIIIAFAAVLPDIDTAASIIGRTSPIHLQTVRAQIWSPHINTFYDDDCHNCHSRNSDIHLEARYLYLLYYRLCFTPASRYSYHKRRETILSIF